MDGGNTSRGSVDLPIAVRSVEAARTLAPCAQRRILTFNVWWNKGEVPLDSRVAKSRRPSDFTEDTHQVGKRSRVGTRGE
jgi:hypothetical protein